MVSAYCGICLSRSWLIIEGRYPELHGRCAEPYPEIAFRAAGKPGKYVRTLGNTRIYRYVLLNALYDLKCHISCCCVLCFDVCVFPRCRILAAVCMSINTFGACIVYVLITAQLLENLMCQSEEDCVVDLSYCIWVLIIAAILVPVSWLGSPKDFWYVRASPSCAVERIGAIRRLKLSDWLISAMLLAAASEKVYEV